MNTAIAVAPDSERTDQATDQERPYRMSLGLYQKIAELEMIRPEEHVVLLDGILVETMTKSPQHHNALNRGSDLLRAAVPRGWSVRVEGPIALQTGLAGVSVPEPDLAVIFGARERHEDRYPEAFDVPLVVEIASSADAFLTDRNGLGRYAFASIPTVWIVTLHDRKIHVYTEPSGPASNPGYGRVEVKRSDELLEATLTSLPDQPPAILGPIAVGSFFP